MVLLITLCYFFYLFVVPLLMAYITRYIFGTDKLRPNGFEVRGMNGSNTGVIQCSDLAVLSNWIKLISDYISILTSHKVKIVLKYSMWFK